jgi:hypothetical protein
LLERDVAALFLHPNQNSDRVAAAAFCERVGIPLVDLEAETTPAALERMAVKALPLFRQVPPPPTTTVTMKKKVILTDSARVGRKRKAKSEEDDLSASAAAVNVSEATATDATDHDDTGGGGKRACLRSTSKLKAAMVE